METLLSLVCFLSAAGVVIGRTTVADVIDSACLPEGTDRLVYRFQNDSHVFVAFDSLRRNRLSSMTWQRRPDDPGQQRHFKHRAERCERLDCLREALAKVAVHMEEVEFHQDCGSSNKL